MIRAKFKVKSIKKMESGCEIELSPVTTGSPENESFYKYTPYGTMTLGLLKHETADLFEIGVDYYIDFTKA